MARQTTAARNAEQTLAELRRKLLFWETNLSVNRDHYWQDGHRDSGIKCEQQLDIVEAALAIIGRD